MDIPREKTKSPKKYIIGTLAVAAVVATTVGLSRLKPAAPGVDRAAIWFGHVERGELVRQVRGPGTLVPEGMRFVSALNSGRIEEKLHLPGDTVSAETVILRMSNPDIELQALAAEQSLSQAEAGLIALKSGLQNGRLAQQGVVANIKTQYLAAQRSIQQNEELKEQNLISESEVQASRELAIELEARLSIEEDRLQIMSESMEEQLDVEERQIARLQEMRDFRRRQLAQMNVPAGANGIIRELNLEAGEWVNSGQLMAVVVQPGRLRADLRIPETQVQDVVVGQFAFIDTRTDTIPGRVQHIDPAAVNGTVRVEVRLEVSELPPSARPDLSVDGTVEIERLGDVLHMGRPAFGSAKQKVGIFRLVQGTNEAVRVTVQLGVSSVNEVEVQNGLAEGDSVILSDMARWDAFDRVRLR
jgi:multidrug efflux pump subunit AcrA (membrane-fusion protein)